MRATAAIAGEPRGRARLGAAFALSVACHALVLAAVPGWRSPSRPVPLLVVSLVGGRADGGAEGPGAGLGSSTRPAIAPPPAAQAAAVASTAPPAVRAASVPSAVVPPKVAPKARGMVAAAAPAAPAARRAAAMRRREGAPEVAAVRADEPTTMVEGARAADDAARERSPGPVDASVHETQSDGVGVDGAPDGLVAAAAAGGGGGTAVGKGGGGNEGLRALCADCPVPDYPARARRNHWQGTVDVALAIGRDGGVAEARVARSSGHQALDEVALAVARRSRFRVPPEGDALRGELRYRFVLDATAARR